MAVNRRRSFVTLLAVVLGTTLLGAPQAIAKKSGKYITCDSARERLMPATGGWSGCYVADSPANVEFARKAVDKAYTDVLEPEGDNFGNTPQGKIDCKTYFDRKNRRGSVLHCIRTFAWVHTHGEQGAHRGTCNMGVGLTYIFAGTKKKNGRMYVRYKPAAAPYGYALTQTEFKDTFGTELVPTKQCRSWTLHQGGDPGAEDPLDPAPLVPPLEEA